MHTAFDAVAAIAKENGVNVAESEIVGLVPAEAMTSAAVHYLLLRNFSSNQIIENRIFGLEGTAESESKNLISLSLGEFADRVSSSAPTPGGGSVAAYSGVLAASLVAMVCGVTVDRKKYEAAWSEARSILNQAQDLKSKLLELVDRDASAYDLVFKAMKLPKTTDEERLAQKKKLIEALKSAADVPAGTMILSHTVFSLAKQIRSIGNQNASSDADSAIQLSSASVLSAFKNVKANLDALAGDESEFTKSKYETLEPLVEDVSVFQG